MKIVTRAFGAAASITNPASTMGLMLTHYKKRRNITRYVEKLLYSKCILQFFRWEGFGCASIGGSGSRPARGAAPLAVGSSTLDASPGLSRLSRHEGGAGCASPRAPLEGCLVRTQRRRAQHVLRGWFDSYQDYSEGEFSRSGDEV